MVMKASGAWRPVIDLSTLNLRIQRTSFKMETLQSVLLSVRSGDWVVSLDLKDAYLQVPMHLDSRRFLGFMVGGKVYQFKVLCFRLSTAPQVFTRVMAPVSAILHRMRVRLRRYLDDWLLQASSRERVLLALRTVLQLCRRLGTVVNWEKSQVLPTQQMVYLGVILDSLLSGLLFSCPEESREASLHWRRILVLRQSASVILAGVFRGAVLNNPTRSCGSPPHEVTPADSSASVGSDRPVSAGRVVAGNPRRSFLVAPPRSLSARRFSGAGVHSARVMVRRLERGLGDSLGRVVRFRLVGSGRRRALDQCSGALGDRECSRVVCSTSRWFLSGGLHQQFDSRVVSAEPRRDSFFFSELHCSEDSPLGGGSVSGDFPTVYYGETQCASGRSSTVQRPSASAPLPPVSSGSVQAVSSCLETIKRFTHAGGFSRRVVQQVSLARRPSSHAGYQSKWLVFRRWCRSEGHSISRPSLPKIADFLFWLRRSRRLSVSSVMDYRFMLSAVFKSVLPEIATSPVLHDLLWSFQAEAPIREVRPPSWDLNIFFFFLRSSSFEPLTTFSLRDLTRKTFFLLSLATAKRVGEIQALM